jgi:hypothetical protein
VDLFIEIDNVFITNTGGGTRDAAGITTNAYNYVNALVTAANVIYELEIDTHLHVNTIKLSTLYDAAVSTSDALGIMKNNYGGSTWHTEGVDVQHALLGKNLGGGIAYIGVLCNSGWGFGLTAGLSGSFLSLDQRVVWDLKAFMHEIGHNFASGHSHDTNYYAVSYETEPDLILLMKLLHPFAVWNSFRSTLYLSYESPRSTLVAHPAQHHPGPSGQLSCLTVK